MYGAEARGNDDIWGGTDDGPLDYACVNSKCNYLFNEFDTKSKNSDLKIKTPNFLGFLGFFKKTKKPRFFKMGLDSPDTTSH